MNFLYTVSSPYTGFSYFTNFSPFVLIDKCSLFLVNNEGPEMYELVCPSQKSKDQ